MYSFTKFLADHIFLQNRDKIYINKIRPWEKHLLIVTVRYGKECKQAFMSHSTMLLHRHLQQSDHLHCWAHHGEINVKVKLSR
jgi:hypothetical protein